MKRERVERDLATAQANGAIDLKRIASHLVVVRTLARPLAAVTNSSFHGEKDNSFFFVCLSVKTIAYVSCLVGKFLSTYTFERSFWFGLSREIPGPCRPHTPSTRLGVGGESFKSGPLGGGPS